MNGKFEVPLPINEPVLEYRSGRVERGVLEKQLDTMLNEHLEIPAIVGGTSFYDFERGCGLCQCPHDFNHVLGRYHKFEESSDITQAVDVALEAKEEWVAMGWEARAAIFLKAADLLAGPYRQVFNAATMLGQSKTVFQAEIDAVCELVDFWRFNVYYMNEIYKCQVNSAPGCWNMLDWRPLEGFVYAVTPFNFTSIAANLVTAPALMGNVVLWKPASSAMYSAYYIMKLLKEAGLPDGVINMLPGSGEKISQTVLSDGRLAGVHFTGSTETFDKIWKTVSQNLSKYKTYPRLVGETGGKDFIFVHKSANVKEVATAIVRGAFEYQGQKCSAASRVYVPQSLWDELGHVLIDAVEEIRRLMGPPTDFKNFMCAVIDKQAYENIVSYIDRAWEAGDVSVLAGGRYSDGLGWWIEPTIIKAEKPDYITMKEELFGPVVTIYV